jgi:hypothetical protein
MAMGKEEGVGIGASIQLVDQPVHAICQRQKGWCGGPGSSWLVNMVLACSRSACNNVWLKNLLASTATTHITCVGNVQVVAASMQSICCFHSNPSNQVLEASSHVRMLASSYTLASSYAAWILWMSMVANDKTPTPWPALAAFAVSSPGENKMY